MMSWVGMLLRVLVLVVAVMMLVIMPTVLQQPGSCSNNVDIDS